MSDVETIDRLTKERDTARAEASVYRSALFACEAMVVHDPNAEEARRAVLRIVQAALGTPDERMEKRFAEKDARASQDRGTE